MIPGLIVGGGALSLLGTGASLYGSYQRDKATRAAQRAYQEAVARKTAEERAALEQEQGALAGLASERQRGIGSYLDDLTYAQRPGTDEGFAQRSTGVLNNIKELTQGQDGVYAYTGAPRTQAETGQNVLTTRDNRQLAESLLADYELGQIQERERGAGHRMAFGDLLREAKGTSLQQRFSLAKALRDLDWQRKTAAMQQRLDEAQSKGQWLNVLGGLGTQLGGMGMTAGLALGGPTTAPTAAPGRPMF